MNARATLLWFSPAPGAGSGVPAGARQGAAQDAAHGAPRTAARLPTVATTATDEPDIAELAPALGAHGITVETVLYREPVPTHGFVVAALRSARASAGSERRIAVGATRAAAASVYAATSEDPAVAAIVLFDGAVPPHVDAPAVAPRGARSHASVPLLQVFDARCDTTLADGSRTASAAAFDAWLRARYGPVIADARAGYTPSSDARTQCRARRDARFVDGAYARARQATARAHAGRTWLALREDESREDESREDEHPEDVPPRARPPATSHTSRPGSSLVDATLARTLADYLAALILHGDPYVRGRPQWPAFDDGARRYLHLGATVRATRDPLIDVLDLEAALDALAARSPSRAPDPSP